VSLFLYIATGETSVQESKNEKDDGKARKGKKKEISSLF
jgi:hypothetical protein